MKRIGFLTAVAVILALGVLAAACTGDDGGDDASGTPSDTSSSPSATSTSQPTANPVIRNTVELVEQMNPPTAHPPARAALRYSSGLTSTRRLAIFAGGQRGRSLVFGPMHDRGIHPMGREPRA